MLRRGAYKEQPLATVAAGRLGHGAGGGGEEQQGGGDEREGADGGDAATAAHHAPILHAAAGQCRRVCGNGGGSASAVGKRHLLDSRAVFFVRSRKSNVETTGDDQAQGTLSEPDSRFNVKQNHADWFDTPFWVCIYAVRISAHAILGYRFFQNRAPWRKIAPKHALARHSANRTDQKRNNLINTTIITETVAEEQMIKNSGRWFLCAHERLGTPSVY